MLFIILSIVIGLALDIWFITAVYAGTAKKASVLKGLASFAFVVLGAYCYYRNATEIGVLILIGLFMGMLGDILLSLRYVYEGKKAMVAFALGILAFLAGHFLYIAALISKNSSIILPAIVVVLVLALIVIPWLSKRVTAPDKAFKILGTVYVNVVIAMFSCGAVLMVKNGFKPMSIVFAIGGLFFMVSDFIMIYFSFGKKVKPLRAINLLTYYVGQLLIAYCILLA